MRGKLIGLTAGLVMLGGLLGPAGAAASDVPACPVGDRQIEVLGPDFVRTGEAVGVTVERDNKRVEWVAIKVGSSEPERFAFGDGYRIRVIRPASRGRSITVVASWTQGAGTPAECVGQDSLAIRVVSATARVGDPDVSRLAGRWRVTYRHGSKTSLSSRWRLTPRCDVFGCATRLRSSGGLRGVLRINDGGRYEVQGAPIHEMNCELRDQASGHLIGSYKVYGRRTITVRALPGGAEAAARLVGISRTRFSIPGDANGLCNVPATRSERVSARRL